MTFHRANINEVGFFLSFMHILFMHAGEFWRLKDSTWKDNKTALFMFLFLIIMA